MPARKVTGQEVVVDHVDSDAGEPTQPVGESSATSAPKWMSVSPDIDPAMQANTERNAGRQIITHWPLYEVTEQRTSALARQVAGQIDMGQIVDGSRSASSRGSMMMV